MRPGKRQREHFFLNFYACFLLPCYTLVFAGSVKWFSTNFSVLAVAGADYYRGFLLWGVLAGGYFLAMLLKLSARVQRGWRRRGLRLLVLLAVAFLGAGLPLPYLPQSFPESARLHVLLIFSACVWMMAAVLGALLSLKHRLGRRFSGYLLCWLAIVAGCAGLFALAGIITTALEVFFTISAALLLRRLWLNVEV